MTTPSGLPIRALQFFGAARGAVNQRVSTRDFYAALNAAATQFGLESHGLTFQNVNQLRSAAASVRNAAEALARAPETNAISAQEIGVTPYARSQADRNAMPIYHVGINLTTSDMQTGETTTDYRRVRFTGQLPATKGELMRFLAQDAEALAETYGNDYVGHQLVEILAV